MALLAILRNRENAYGMSIAREIELHSGREVALAGIYAALERPMTRTVASKAVRSAKSLDMSASNLLALRDRKERARERTQVNGR
jgi:hypothetical protein